MIGRRNKYGWWLGYYIDTRPAE